MDTQSKQTIELPGGKLEAVRDGELVRARGIKYAEAKRFATPRLLEKWDGVLDCTKAPPICPQNLSRFSHIVGYLTLGRTMAEDCLSLSVTAPANALKGQKLPVMVWFHGGAYVAGAGDLDAFSGNGLASRDVVVVHINHRLGVLGYLAIEDVAPANLGLLDQIEALKWVQRNISHFGGDPEKVTLFGQSAGADSIYCILLSEGTQGLFHRAILQSAPLGLPFKTEPALQAMSNTVKSILPGDLLDVSVEQLLELQLPVTDTAMKFGQGSMAFGPCFGRFPLPPRSEIDSRVRAVAKDIPVLIGWTKNEGRPYVRMIDRLAPYADVPIIGPLLESILSWIITAHIFRWPAKQLHSKLVKAGGQSTTYAFNWSPLNSPLQATHCMELPFLLGDWRNWEAAPMLKGDESFGVYESLGRQLKSLWTAFAKGEDLGAKHFEIDKSFVFNGVVTKTE